MIININNIHKYKKAIVMVKDLNKVIILYNKFLQDIQPYIRYTPVMDSYRSVVDCHKWVQIHLEYQQKIVDNTGIDE